MPILTKYKNQLLETLEERGFQKSQFISKDVQIKTLIGFQINLRNTPLMITIQNPARDYHLFRITYTKFSPQFDEETWPNHSELTDFKHIKGAFIKWLKDHVAEYFQDLGSINLWTRIMQSKTSIYPSEESDTEDISPFSLDEKTQIRLSITEFHSNIVQNYNPSDPQLKSIERRLDYLEKRLDKLNRIDWKSLAITTFFRIASTLALDREKAIPFFNLAKKIFSNITHFLPFLE